MWGLRCAVAAALVVAVAATGCTRGGEPGTPRPQVAPVVGTPTPTPAGGSGTVSPLLGSTPATPSPSPSPPALSVRVMTYNILSAKVGKKGISKSLTNWGARDDQVARWITWNDPDVISFQENYTYRGRPQLKTIDDEKLGAYQFVQMNTEIPIAFKKSRFKLAGSGIVRIATKGKNHSSFDRWLTWVKLVDKKTGFKFTDVNVHLSPHQENRPREARSVQVDRIVAQLKKILAPGDAFTLTGDFNAKNTETKSPANDHLTKLAAQGIVDSATLAKTDDSEVPRAASFSNLGVDIDGKFRYGAVKTYNYHYDYVFVPKDATVERWRVSSGPGTRQVEIGGRSYPFFAKGVVPSDHSPVVATVSFYR